MKRPSKQDASRPTGHGYDYKKQFYRSDAVADDYDFHRFGSRDRQRRNRRKWAAIQRALEVTAGVESILDMPCGTGRFTGHLADRGYQVIGSDISLEMIVAAQEKTGTSQQLGGYLQADAEALPFPDDAFDCVMSIRFMMHVDSPTRVRMLREMGRVSRRWLIVDYRHRYTLRYLKWKLLSSLGLTKKPFERVSSQQLQEEFGGAGLSITKVIPVTRAFSDKWIVIGEPASSS